MCNEDSFQKASMLVTQAVTADRDKDFGAAINHYEESLKYFLPLVHYEQDPKMKEKLRARVEGYQKRCRELKSRTGGHSDNRHAQLTAVCRTSSNLMTGIEICLQGEEYLGGGEHDMALDRFTAGLGVLVPALQQEPKGVRRDLLRKEVKAWMEVAERLKQCSYDTNEVESRGSEEAEKKSCKVQ